MEKIFNVLRRLYNDFSTNLMKTIDENKLYISLELFRMLIEMQLHHIQVIYKYTDENTQKAVFNQINQLISIFKKLINFTSEFEIFKYDLLTFETTYLHLIGDEKYNETVEEYIDFAKENKSQYHIERAESLKEKLSKPFNRQKDFSKMSDDEIKEAMKKEPAWGTTITAEYDGGDCTSGPSMAKALGYYDNWGLDVQIAAGTEITEALGTGKAQFGVHHIAHMLVPITNGMDIVFTGSAQTGCKSLYVLADSGIESTKDLEGTTVGMDSPIGGSSHNMIIRFFLADGLKQDAATCVQVESSAAIQSLQSGDIKACLLSDRFAKKFVDDGTLKVLRSITWDDDFKDETCCVMAMSGKFVKENPVISQVLTKCVMDAYMYIAENKDEAAQIMLDEGMVSGDIELTKYMLDQQNWAVSNADTKETIKAVAKDYIAAGIITSDWTVDKVVETAWHPLAEKVSTK